jgi:hypothetical protein
MEKDYQRKRFVDVGADVDLCPDGGYIMPGATASYGPENSNPKSEIFLIRLDSSGYPLWRKVKGRTNSTAPGAYLSITGDGSTLTMSTFSNEVSTDLNTGAYSIYTNDPMICQVTGVSGSLSLVVAPAIAGTDPMSPGSGGAELPAQDGSKVNMAVSTGGNGSLEVDTDADGTIDSTIPTTFDDLY